ncbi:Ig-like domain-containing protein [Flavobacterium olei]|uniref:Ig-like domain-containing protein n=1 Tax=Flavobacterium olei TaxID=1886782 RepID=UPI003219436B
MKNNKLLIILILFGFLTFGMSYNNVIKENIVGSIIKKIHKVEESFVNKKGKDQKVITSRGQMHKKAAFAPSISVLNSVAVNGGGTAVPGSQLDFTITITNNGIDSALGTAFQDILDSNLTLVPGSLKATPISVDDTYNCIGNVGIVLNAAQGVLANDISPDGTLLTSTVLVNPSHGTVNLSSNGSFTYNSAAGYSGLDSFTYTLTTASGKTSTGTVNINVTTPIFFVNSAATVNGNGTLASPFKTVDNATGTGSNPIFIYSGASGNALTLGNNQKVIGQGATSSLVSILNLTPPSYSNALPATGGTSPTFSVLNLNTNNDIQGIILSGSSATMTGSNVGALKVRDASILGGTATALNIISGGIVDCIFKTISANGGVKGISVNATGSIYVTGTGTTAGSGGTIQNIQNRGAEFISCTVVSLKNMTFINANTSSAICNNAVNDNSGCNGAIHLKGISTKVDLDNISITGITNSVGININDVNNLSLTNSTLTGCGSFNGGNSEVGGIMALNLKGTCSITNTNVNDSWGRGFYGYNGILSQNPSVVLTVTSSQFKNSFNRANGGSNFAFEGYGSSNNTLILKKNDFSNSKTDGLTLNFGGTSTNSVQVGGPVPTDGNIINAPSVSPGGNGLSLQAVGSAVVNYNIIYNTLKSSFNGSFACNVGHQDNGSMTGRINNNIVEGSGIGTVSNGISVAALGNSKHITEILNNTINNASNYGIQSEVNDNNLAGTARMDATIKNNTVNAVANSYANVGIVAVATASSSIKNAANIGGNTINNPSGILVNFDVLSYGASSQVILQGATALNSGVGDRSAALKLFWDANNPTPGTAIDEMAGQNGTGTIISGNVTPPSNISASKMVTVQEDLQSAAVQEESTKNIQPESTQTAKNNSVQATTATTLSAGPFTLPAGKSTVITFSATINAAGTLPQNTCAVTNQATVSGSNFATVNSNITTTSIKPTNATVTTDTQNITCLGSTAVTLNATCPLATTATWYTSLTGGTSFATGASVSATPVANNTTYCVACEAAYCSSDRVLVKTVTGTPSTIAPDQVVTACDSYTWSVNGTKYTSSGTYSVVVGCETKTLKLTITPSDSAADEVVKACDSYIWAANGTKYTSSGTYTTVVNCQTRTLKLTITPSTSLPDEVVEACDSYIWTANGTQYTSSGTYTTVVNCQTRTLKLTITPSTSLPDEVVEACDSYTWIANGTKYTSSGTYTNKVGCVTRTLKLTVTPSTIAADEVVNACDSYTWAANGIKYTTSGTYTTVVDCQTRTLKLTITPSTSLPDEVVEACDSYIWTANGTQYTSSGTYTNKVGCVTRTLKLTITPYTSSSQTENACSSYIWSVNGTRYTTSGTYTHTVGCDTKTLVLTITNSTNSTQTETACSSYTWSVNGVTYTSSGTYTYTDGCDTKNLILTITNTSTNTEVQNACDSYTWPVNGITYTTSGTYTYTADCDTKLLVLTITNSTNSTQTENACSSYTWPVNGVTYTSSGTYTHTNGCDTKNLVLTITNTSTNTEVQNACDSYTWPVNGITYTSSGTFTHTLGCETKTLSLIITDSTTTTETVTACKMYVWPVNGTTFSTSGVYSHTVGCDTKTLILTINDPSAIQKTVSLNSGIVTADYSGASYQWYKCPDTALSNETNQSFTPTLPGDYKVAITVGECTVVSDCITVTNLGVDDFKVSNFKMYPVPSKGILNILTKYDGKYIIVDSAGKLVKSVNLNADVLNTIHIEDLADGVYLIKNTNNQSIKTQKFILKK